MSKRRWIAFTLLLLMLAGLSRKVHAAEVSSAPAQLEAAWSGLALVDPEGGKLQAHLLLQSEILETGPSGQNPTWSSGLHRARPLVHAESADGALQATLQMELAGDAHLLDARVDWRVAPQLTVGGGQLIVPFTRAWNTPLARLALGERSVANNSFAPGRRMGTQLRLDDPSGHFHATAGLYTNAGVEAVHALLAPTTLLRLDYTPAGVLPASELAGMGVPQATGVALGLAVLEEYVGEIGAQSTSLTADVVAQRRGTQGAAAVYGRTQGSAQGWGVSAQITQVLAGEHLALVLRGSAVDLDRADKVEPELVLEPAVSLHAHNGHLRVLVGGSLDRAPQGDSQQVNLRVQASI